MRMWCSVLIMTVMISVAIASADILTIEPNGTGYRTLEDGRGVIIKDLSGMGGQLSIGLADLPPGAKKKEKFEMVDGTLQLQVISGLSDYRACVMRKASRRLLDAAGILPGSWILMKPREDGGEMVWRPLTDYSANRSGQWVLYRERIAPSRERIRMGTARGRIGSYGYYTTADTVYVWGVVHGLSDWGIGGMVPEPAGLLLVAGGAGLLCLQRRRSR